MQMRTFWAERFLPNRCIYQQIENLAYLNELGADKKPLHGSRGIRALIIYLISQKDVVFVKTEVSLFRENKRLKSDLLVHFTNGAYVAIEFNGAQHFTYSHWYPTHDVYDLQNQNLIYKELDCLCQNISCLNINDLIFTKDWYLNEPLDNYEEYKKTITETQKQYYYLFEDITKGYCPQLRRALSEVKNNLCITTLNIKPKKRDWVLGFRNHKNKELNKIITNMCNDLQYDIYI